MLRSICPVLAEQPVYLVDHRTAPELNIPRGVLAWAGWKAPYAVRPFVNWQGAGFATVLRMDRIHPDDLTALVLHELCHWLPLAALVARADRHEGFQQTAAEAGETSRAADLTAGLPENLPRPWSGHGPEFVRLYLHATWRASRAGFPIRQRAAYDWWMYRTAPLRVWQRLLRGEPHRLRGLALQDVAAEAAPAAYTEFSDRWLTEADARLTGANTWD